MKKLIIATTYLIIFCSCERNETEPDLKNESRPFLNDFSKIVETLTLTDNLNDTIYQKEYLLDSSGRVYEFRYFNIDNPQYNSASNFLYDENNRLIQQYKNGVLFKEYHWIENSVHIELISNGNLEKVTYSEHRIQYFETGDGKVRSFKWDNENVISVSNSDDLIREYHGYDKELINPYYYLKSIELDILQSVWIPISKTIHKFRTDQSYDGDDYSVSQRTYEYNYAFNHANQVISSENELSLIYTTHFEYYR